MANPATRLIETVTEIVGFAKTHCREPKRIFGTGKLSDSHIALEFSFSQDREDTRWKLDREFGNRLNACIKPFSGVGERSETIREWFGPLREAVRSLLHFEHSIQHILAWKASRGMVRWLRQGAAAAYVDHHTREATSALKPFREMEDILNAVSVSVVTNTLNRERQPDPEAHEETTLAKYQDPLTPLQKRIVKALWSRKRAVQFDTLRTEAWKNDDISDSGIERRLKDVESRWAGAGLLDIDLEILTATTSVKLHKLWLQNG